MADPLDAANWAGRRTGSLVRFRRSPREAVSAIALAVVLYFAASSQEQEVAAIVRAVAAVIVAYFLMPLLEVSWQAFRAPSLQLQTANLKLEKDSLDLRSQLDSATKRLNALEEHASAFDLRVLHGSLRVIRNDQNAPRQFYVVVADASITNASDMQVPLSVSLRIDLSDSMAISEVAKSLPLPDWALADTTYPQCQRLERYVTIPERTASTMGYWAFKFSSKGLVEIDPNTVEARPMWLELENTITQQVRLFAINDAARVARAIRKGPKVLPTE
jgi:hypothetical protein